MKEPKCLFQLIDGALQQRRRQLVAERVQRWRASVWCAQETEGSGSARAQPTHAIRYCPQYCTAISVELLGILVRQGSWGTDLPGVVRYPHAVNSQRSCFNFPLVGRGPLRHRQFRESQKERERDSGSAGVPVHSLTPHQN